MDVANNSKTGEKYVVYRSLYDKGELWVRPLDMFLSKVGQTKYSDIGQKYRFELQDIDDSAK